MYTHAHTKQPALDRLGRAIDNGGCVRGGITTINHKLATNPPAIPTPPPYAITRPKTEAYGPHKRPLGGRRWKEAKD